MPLNVAVSVEVQLAAAWVALVVDVAAALLRNLTGCCQPAGLAVRDDRAAACRCAVLVPHVTPGRVVVVPLNDAVALVLGPLMELAFQAAELRK